MPGRLSRRRFLQSSAVLSGALMGTLGAGWPEGLVDASVPTVRGIALLAGGMGYPGLANKAVLGAELQYFRMTNDKIPGRLELCRQAHYSLIQTYVPWNVHEYVPGLFDFTGQLTPVLPDDHVDEYQIEGPLDEIEAAGLIGRSGVTANSDLESYLAMCASYGFKMILRPGPFISDEWCNGGMPYWMLAEGEPEMYECGPDGTSITPGFPFSPPLAIATGGGPLYYFPSPSYASDYFMSATKAWLTNFVEFLTDGQWFEDQGGPVVGLQVDDESCFFYKFAPFEVDYNPDMLARWDSYSGNLEPPRDWPDASGGIESLKTPMLWHRFKAEQQATYLEILADNLTSAGAKVPINHELEQDMVPPADMVADAGVVILNGEFYQGSDATVLPSNEIIAQSVRAAARQLRPTFATEMDNGDALLFNLLLGEGIFGGLQFTYTEGVADGALQTLTTVGQTFDTAGPMLGQATRRADVAVVWDTHQCWTPWGADRWGFRTDVRAVIEKHVPALLTLLIRAGYAFDFLDVNVAEPEDLARYRTIFYAASDICPSGFQTQLVNYVGSGGRLVCWPAAPIFDEYLDTCTTLRDALYNEDVHETVPADGVDIMIGELAVPVWHGVDIFELGRDALPIATLDGRPCGYASGYGKGVAVLLGTWLAADSVCGRDGDTEAEESITSPEAAPLVLAQLATKYLGTEAAGLIPNLLPGGAPQNAQVWFYANQRHGGEVISSGTIAYFDGENVIGVVEQNSDPTEPLVQTLPYHPILPSHIEAVRRLADLVPQVTANDTHLQARILDGPEGGATVAVCNRFFVDIDASLETVVDGLVVRLPRVGTFTLPSQTGVLCPIGYQLDSHRRLVQATAQLLEVASTSSNLQLTMLAPGGGEVVVEFEVEPTRITVNGASTQAEHLSSATGVMLALALDPGGSAISFDFS